MPLSWADLFERAAGHEVALPAICDELGRLRDGSDAETGTKSAEDGDGDG